MVVSAGLARSLLPVHRDINRSLRKFNRNNNALTSASILCDNVITSAAHVDLPGLILSAIKQMNSVSMFTIGRPAM